MPSSNRFVDQLSVVRGSGLGPGTLNRLGENTQFLDEFARIEHRANGVHNAQEIPLILGKVAFPTNYLFDSTWFASSANPATGKYEIVAQSAVDVMSGTSCLINISDGNISLKPHMAVWQPGGGGTTHKTPIAIYELSSPLGVAPGSGGNVWALQNRTFDFALHASPTKPDVTTLGPLHSFVRGEFLTTDTNGWNRIVTNQEAARKTLGLEHTAAGAHNVARIAKSVSWFKPTAGPSMALAYANGPVDNVSYVGAGICIVYATAVITASSLNNMVAFIEPQPASPGEVLVAHAAPSNVSHLQWAVFIYRLTDSGWERVDRSFLFIGHYT